MRQLSRDLRRWKRSTGPVLLSFLIGAGFEACSPDAETSGGGPSRVATVPATASAVSETSFCDISYEAGNAPRLNLPPLSPIAGFSTPEIVPSGQWVWVNLWATWCGPCKREMPLLARWEAALKSDGVPLSLWYLSVDEDAVALDQYLSQNTDLKGKSVMRMAHADALGDWLKTYGLGGDAAIPIQLLVGTDGRVRCVKTGGLHESDFHRIKSLLK